MHLYKKSNLTKSIRKKNLKRKNHDLVLIMEDHFFNLNKKVFF